MKQYSILLFLLLLTTAAIAQRNRILGDTILLEKFGGNTVAIIKGKGTITQAPNNGDSSTAIPNTAWVRRNASGGTGGTATFTNNITLNGGSGNRLGYWVEGETIPVAGKTLDEAFTIITQRAIAPTYLAPQAGIGASPGVGTYEIGTNLSTINLSSTYNQRDGGAELVTTYYQNGTALPGTSTTISSLTSTQTFYVNKSYSQGACKNNNLGVQDCSGRINAGNVNSGSISYTTGIKYFMGACAGPEPTDAEIRAAAEQAFSSSRGQANKNIAANNQYVFYAYLDSYGALNRIFNSLGDFTLDAAGFKPTTKPSFTNAQGFNTPLRVYTLQTPQGGNVNGLTFQ